MLFTESKFMNCDVDSSARLPLLESLREKITSPLIQEMRRRCYEMAFDGDVDGADEPERLRRMEQTIAKLSELDRGSPYVQGDLFFFEDHVLFLTFKDSTQAVGIQAGIIYTRQTNQPLRKLDAFCHEVGERVVRASASKQSGSFAGWRRSKTFDTTAFERFLAKQDVDFLFTAVRRETAPQRVRAAELLDDDYTREFLRRTREAHLEGCPTKLLKGEVSGESGFSIDRLSEAGLVLREVLISCRTTGHALFRLPSADALAVITVSNAKCSECGALVADERVEDVIAPTELAAALLQDAAWLVNRLYTILRRLGVPATEIAIAPVTNFGEAHLMVNICGEAFLFVLRDGDLTPALARRAIDAEMETGVARLVVVATGRARDEARMFLSEHARRRARAGRDIEVMIIEGVDAVSSELSHTLERFSRDLLAEELCALDANLGFSASRLVMARFEMLQTNLPTNADSSNTHSPQRREVKFLLPSLDHESHDASGAGERPRDLSLSL